MCFVSVCQLQLSYADSYAYDCSYSERGESKSLVNPKGRVGASEKRFQFKALEYGDTFILRGQSFLNQGPFGAQVMAKIIQKDQIQFSIGDAREPQKVWITYQVGSPVSYLASADSLECAVEVITK